MKFEDFVDALIESGWRPVGDAQHELIKELHRRLWPVIAELESKVSELESEVENLGYEILEAGERNG